MTPTFRSPEELRKHLIKEQIKPGIILQYFYDFIIKPHNKFIVIVCIDPQILGFFINSYQNDCHNLLDDYFKAQIPIQKREYTFLEYDSFLDCSEFVKDITMEGIISQIIKCKPSEDRIKGNVSGKVIQKIIKILKESELLEPMFIEHTLNSLK